MNTNDFLHFMDQPNLQARIVREFNSIISEQGAEQKGCNPLVHYLRRKKLNDEANQEASFVDGYDTHRKFLCIKNPSVKDRDMFWQAVWDNKVQIIVMTCQLIDQTYQYWSPKERYTLVNKKFNVKTLKIIIFPHYTITVLSLYQTGPKYKQSRPIFHYQYTAWPKEKFDHQLDAFVEFHNFVNERYVKLKKQVADKTFPPMLVHCNEGIGSSDVFCALDMCIYQLKATGIVSLPHTLKIMRQQKFGSFCHSDLYVLSYRLIKAYLDNN
ncbi:tyrosine-protein phosphatase non-receptor type 9-like [Cydia pomonella]|uniref:tyrosine-protein phosphatase non-receptor type 9-like n=1 Tax=Cydia pomonella TaxID=82600 RepID=UPI002ADE6BE1|nr:tyrosine-protein phosphatase non-receptor type 9-like [Cydia pomonella]